MVKNKIPEYKINIDWTCSAIGDTVCFLPILKVLYNKNLIEAIMIDKNYQHLADVISLEIPENHIIIKDYNIKYKSDYRIVKSFTPYPSSIHAHLVDYASLAIADAILPQKDRTYPMVNIKKLKIKNKPKLPNNFYVMQCGHTSDLKKMPIKTFTDIVNYFIKEKKYLILVGRDYEVQLDDKLTAFINPSSYLDKVPESKYIINLLNKTSIHETIYVISKSKALLGMDSGIIHLGGLTKTPIICAYTHKDPEYLMPIRENKLGHNVYPIIPEEGVCRFCMTEYYCQFGWDYKKCANGNFECCENITANKFIKVIENNIK